MNGVRQESRANPYVRILLIGLMTMAIGSTIVGLGSVGSGTDRIMSVALGGLAILGGVVLFVTGVLGQRRTRPAQATLPSARVIVTDYIRLARTSRVLMVRASFAVLFWLYSAIACVVSVFQSKWALAAVYGVVAVSLLVLAFVTASAIDRKADPE